MASKRIITLVLSIIAVISAFYSCKEDDTTDKTMSLPGLWHIVNLENISNAATEDKHIYNAKDNHMYYQFNSDKSYRRCFVKYEDTDTTVNIQDGTWELSDNTILLTPIEDTSDICSIELERSDDYPMGTASIGDATYYFGAERIQSDLIWRTDVVNEAKKCVCIPRDVKYGPKLFTDNMSTYSSQWIKSDNGEVDFYFLSNHAWQGSEAKESDRAMIVQYAHGKITVNQYDFVCDSIEIDVEEYEVPSEEISTSWIMKAYLLPGSHTYPILFDEKFAIIERGIDGLPDLKLEYKGGFDKKEIKNYHIVPWTFDFSSYK